MPYLLIAIGLMMAIPAAADTANLRFICTLYKSSDASVEHEVPRRQDVVTVKFSVDGKATITSKLHQNQLKGMVTEHDISGRWSDPNSSEEIHIDRYTAEYRYRALPDNPSLAPMTTFGSCQMAGKQSP